jgi:hypothetical protein
MPITAKAKLLLQLFRAEKVRLPTGLAGRTVSNFQFSKFPHSAAFKKAGFERRTLHEDGDNEDGDKSDAPTIPVFVGSIDHDDRLPFRSLLALTLCWRVAKSIRRYNAEGSSQVACRRTKDGTHLFFLTRTTAPFSMPSPWPDRRDGSNIHFYNDCG